MAKFLLFPNTKDGVDITLSDNATCFEMIWETGGLIDVSEYDLSVLEFVCESAAIGSFPDYMVSDMGCPVVSAKLKELFEQNGIDNIQYFPASITQQKDGEPVSGYYAANILGLIDCIDLDQSEYDGDLEDGEVVCIYDIDSLSLKTPEFTCAEIFRPWLFRSIILVDERIKNLLNNVDVEGVKFITPEDWEGSWGD